MTRHAIALSALVLSLGAARIFAAEDPQTLQKKTYPVIQTREARSTRLFIQTHPSGARIDLDGVTLGFSDDLFHVSPGAHTITAVLRGHLPQHHQIHVARNEIGRVTLALESEPAEGPVEITPIAVASPGRSSVLINRPDLGDPDYPWGSLDATDEPASALALEGHEGHVNWVEFSPDGGILASASADNTIRLWRVPGGRLRQVLVVKDSRFGVYCATFSPDGQTLASCAGTSVQLWDVETGRWRRTGGPRNARGAAYSDDGRTLAVAIDEERLALCDPDSLNVRTERIPQWDIKRILLPHDDSVRRIADSRDGNLRAFAGGWHPRSAGRVAVWNARTPSLMSSFQVPGGYVRTVAISPNGRFLAYAAGNTVKLVAVSRLPRPGARR